MRILSLLFIVFGLMAGSNECLAQADTIHTFNGKLQTERLQPGKSSYAVYFEDSSGNRITSADIWDRSIHFSNNEQGERIYHFEWKWYHRDSLFATVNATGNAVTLQPYSHTAEYLRRPKMGFNFAHNTVTVDPALQHTARDSAFKVQLDIPAFEFPMDLEIFSLLPFKKTGQTFAIAFYEPGSPKANYYPLTVTGKASLLLPGGISANCWLLRIDYAKESYATFWISTSTYEVLKMQEYYKGRYRYKVKLY